MLRRLDQNASPDTGSRRSVTLLRVFLLASALILLAGGLGLSWILTTSLRDQAIADRRESLSQYVAGVLRPSIVRDGGIVVHPSGSRKLLEGIHRQHDIVSVKVWKPDGTLAWTNRDAKRIGKRFELEGDLGEVIASNRSKGSINALSADGEDAFEHSLGIKHLLEVYAPVQDASGTRAIGVYEIYADAAPLQAFIDSRRKLVWLAVATVFLVLYAALALLVRGASKTLRRQTIALDRRSQELLESYRRLEESSLEAIESLNATVEAKDPYTAGHSQRVQGIALALGKQLGLTSERLDALRFGSLFHDIGKLAVPDAVLLKPARLTADEYELMKRHSADGAQIVAKLYRLREAVPIIRHHHERWDGRGYPEGLAGESIAMEAAIVGLADAWDAMTTERPYARALTLAEALAQIREGRGTQFSPRVTDAFLELMRGNPASIAGVATVGAEAA
jgi:putative nucleotidyltransferase with HDIG domain